VHGLFVRVAGKRQTPDFGYIRLGFAARIPAATADIALQYIVLHLLQKDPVLLQNANPKVKYLQ